jgi:predicted permease
VSRLASLWRNLTRRADVERDLDDELRATLETLTAEKIGRGMDPAGARRAATLELGGVESIKEQVRHARSGASLESVFQDLRYAVRLLVRNPLFTLTAALSLAIGIGATTSIFSVANGMLLRPAVGVADPGRLVDIVGRDPAAGPDVERMSYPDLLEFRRHATAFDGVYAYQLQLNSVGLRFEDGVTAGFSSLVTTNYFRVLGVTAAAGRVFDAGDSEQAGAAPVVVLSHAFWMRRFKGDPSIVGQTVRIRNSVLTIVGVAARGFNGLSVVAPDLWLPVTMVAAVSPEGSDLALTNRGMTWLLMGGRLERDVSRAPASAQTAAIGAALQRSISPDAFRAPGSRDPAPIVWSAEVATPIPYGLRGIAGTFLALLLTLVGIVLVIACANLAGVLLARATGRRREIAVRPAVGAARARLVRQLLTETVLLFGLGGAVGLLLARVMTSLLVSLLPQFRYPVTLSTPLDGTVVTFALVLSFVAAVLSGLAPALHASRSDVVTALKDNEQGPSDRLRLRNAFVVAQVAGSILLVVTAGLLVRAFDNTLSRARGFDARGVDVASLDLTMGGYTEATGRDVLRRILAEVRAQPGIVSASIADRAPSPGARSFGPVTVPGDTSAAAAFANWTLVDPGYFATIGIPIISGRDFTEADREGAEPVAIVGQAAAARLWPGRDPLGQLVVVGSGRSSQGPQLKARGDEAAKAAPRHLRVVGVAGDLDLGGQDPRATTMLYVPLQQRYVPQVTILARRDPDGASVAVVLRDVVAAIDANLPVFDADALERQGDGPVQTQLRIAAAVAGSVGVVWLFLAAIGIYGVTAYAVTQRTREIGIRLSLGAGHGDVIGLILRQGMRLVAVGSAIGLSLALGAGQLLAGRQFGIPQNDPLTLAGAVVLFAIVGLVACYVPVRRAARIRAMEALRYE